MSPSNQKNLISTKEAGEISGYSSDYLSRLARSGKISGRRIGHSWMIDKESFDEFIALQDNRKIDRARALARARAEEYRASNNAYRTLASRVHKILPTSPIEIRSSSGSFNRSLPASIGQLIAPRLYAFLMSVLVLTSGALAARADALPDAARYIGDVALETSSAFAETFGDIPSRIARRLEEPSRIVSESKIRVASGISSITASDALPSLVKNIEELRLVASESKSVFESAVRGKNIYSAPAVQPIDVASVIASAVSFFTSPQQSVDAVSATYQSIGESGYGAIKLALDTWPRLVNDAGRNSLSLGIITRDTLSQAPLAVHKMNLAFVSAVADVTRAAIRAHVSLAYGISDAGPASAQIVSKGIGEVGEVVAGIAARAPYVAVGVFFKAAGMPSKVGPAIAEEVFNAEYSVATRFVRVMNRTTEGYISFVQDAGDLAYTVLDNGRIAASASRDFIARAPREIENSYLGVLGKSAVALLNPARTFFNPINDAFNSRPVTETMAAAIKGLSAGERAAVTTYEVIRSFTNGAGNALAYLFGSRAPEVVVVQGISPRASPVVVTQTARDVAAISYPTYTTVVRGITQDDMDRSFVSLRNEILSTVSGMVLPVARQTVTNITTIQQVNRIEKLANLIVENGDFRGGKLSDAYSVSATYGYFDNLTTGIFATGATTITSTLDVSGTVTAPNFIATSTTATSTFAGRLAVGTSTPTGNGLFTVGTTTPLLYIDSNTGKIGVGTTSPAVAFDLYATDAMRLPVGTTVQRPGTGDVGYVRYNLTTHQFEGFGDNAVWQGLGGVIDADQSTKITADTNNTDEDTLRFFTADVERMVIGPTGLFGIGTTTPYAKFSIHAVNGETNATLFAIASSTASATSTLFSITNVGRVGIGTSSPITSLHISGTDGLVIPVGSTAERPSTLTTGIIRYNSQTQQFEGYGTSSWGSLGGVIDVDQDTKITAEDSAGADNDQLKFFTFGVERMRIDSNGLIGLGTTTPFANLSIAGSAGGTTNLFAISTSTAASATTTALIIDRNGNLSLLNGANLSVGGNLTVTGTSAFTGAINAGVGNNVILSTNSSGQLVGTSTPSAANYLATSTTATSTFAGYLSTTQFANTAMTAGSIPFFGAGGYMNQSNANLFYDAANNRLGIGTTTPGAKLSVEGSSLLGNSATAGYFTATTTTASTFPNASTTLASVASGLYNTYLTATRVPYTTTNGLLTDSSNLTFNGTTLTANALSLTTALPVTSGGTGWSAVQASSIPYGNGTSALATTTAGTAGYVLAYLSGIPSWTATTTFSSPLNYSAGNVSLGYGSSLTTSGSNLILNMANANTWTALQSFANASSSLFSNTGTAYFGATATSTFDSAGNLAVAGTLNVTGQTTLAASLSGLAQLASGVVSAITGTAGQFPYYSGTNTLLATSTIFVSTASNIGIGTTTPGAKFSVEGSSLLGNSATAGYFTATTTTASTFPNASTTLASVATALYNTYLTSTRVPYTTTNGLLTDSANLTFNGTTLTANALALTTALPVTSGGTGWSAIQASSIPYGNGTSALATTTAGTAGYVLAYLNNIPTWTATTTFSSPLNYSAGNVSLGYGSSLTTSGSNLILNMANANSWTALQSFANASSTLASVTSKAYFGGTSTTTIDSAGSIVLPSAATLTLGGYTGIISSNAASGITARTLTGTASRLTVSNGDGTAGNPTFDISASYIGQSSITTLGTITSGTWNGTTIAVANGGTGTTTAPLSQLLYGGSGSVYQSVATTTFTPSAEFSVGGTIGAFVGGANSTLTLATNGIALTKLAQIAANTILGNATGATANVTAIATSSLGIALSDTTGTLAIARGGTGQTSFTADQIHYGNFATVATSSLALGTGLNLSAGSLGYQIGGTNATIKLADTAVTAASYGSSTAIPTFTVDQQGRLTAASTAVVIAPAGTLTGTTLASNVVTSSLTSLGTITSGTWNGTTIAVANGGTGATTLTGLLQGNGTSAITAVTGSTGQFPYYNGTNTLLATSTIFVSTAGNVGLGTTTPGAKFSVEGSSLLGNSATAGYFTATTTTASTFPNASTTLASVASGLYNTYLTATRVPYTTTNGLLTDSSNLTFNGTTLTANALALTNALPVTSGGTGTTTAPVSQLLYGGSGAYQSVATSSASCTSGISCSAFTVVGTVAPSITNTGVLSLTQNGGGAAQTGALTFATSSQTTNGDTVGLTITNSSGTFTFAPTLSGTRTVAGGGTGATTLTGLLQGNGTSAITAITGTAGQFPYYNGTNTLLATSTIFLATSGNIGIGNASPGYALDVTGSANISGQYKVNGVALTLGQWTVSGNDQYNTNTGNVGIGTSTPYSKLSVWGADTGANIMANFVNSASTSVMAILNNGNVGIGTTAITSTYGFTRTLSVENPTNAELQLKQTTNSNTLSIGITNGLNYFQSTQGYNFQTAGASRLTLFASGGLGLGSTYAGSDPGAGNMIIQGNVGIGTTSPQALLHISSTGSLLPIIESSGNGTNSNLQFKSKTAGAVAQTWTIGPNQALTSADFEIRDTTAGATLVTVQKSTGNVGIGTTAPIQPLHVVGNEYVTSWRIGAAGAPLTWNIDSTSKYVSTNYAGAINMETADGRMAFYTAPSGTAGAAETSTERLTITNTGNVGIGTTNPSTAKLVLSGTSAGAAMDIINTTASTGKNMRLVSLNAGGMAIEDITAGVGRVTIDTNGNVGIGTTTPLSKLAVSGGASVGADYNIAAPTNGMIIQGNVGIGTTAPRAGLGVSANPSITIKGTNGGYAGRSGALFFESLDGVGLSAIQGSSDGSYDLQFFTGAAPTPSERMRIAYATGNVGIGTTGPYGAFDVNRTASGELGRFRANVADGVADVVIVNDVQTWGFRVDGGNADTFNIRNFQNSTNPVTIKTDGNVGIGTTTPSSKLQVTGDSNNNWGVTQGGQFAISGLSDPRQTLFLEMNTTSNYGVIQAVQKGVVYENLVLEPGGGNVGIGTTGPGKKLEVSGDLSVITGATSANNPILYLGKSLSASEYGYLQWTDASNRLDIGTQVFGPTVSITEAGNVGIGTTGPGAELEVKSTTSSSEIYTTYSTTAQAELTAGSDGNVYIGSRVAGSNVILRTGAASEAVRILSSGNVGIGTTTPTAKLEISEPAGGTQVYSDGLLIRENSNSNDNGLGLWYSGSGNTKTYIENRFDNSAAEMRFRMRAAGTPVEAMTILGTGNVGIGTTTPVTKLDVAGTIRTTIVPGSYYADATYIGTTYNFGSSETTDNVAFTIAGGGTWTTGGGFTFTTGNSGKIRFDKAGNVGIGTTNPGAQLDLSTDSARKLTTTTWSTGSDIRFKTNVQTITNALDVIGRLRPVQYHYNAEFLAAHPSVSDVSYYNFIAQEYQQVFPDSVTETDGRLYLNSSNMIPYAIAGIKELAGQTASTTASLRQIQGFDGVLAVESVLNAQCVTGDTRLRRRRKRVDGSFEFDEIAIADVVAGDEILSLNEQTGKVEYHRVNALMPMGVQEVYEIVTKSGRRIRTTSTHPYLVRPAAEFA